MAIVRTLFGTPIRNLQNMLRFISRIDPVITSVIPDGIYGPQTRISVESFQTKYNLPVTGETDYATWERIAGVFQELAQKELPPVGFEGFPSDEQGLTIGDTGDGVYVVQLLLNEMSKNFENFEKVVLTGVYDIPTSTLVARFQPLAGLPATGDVDKKTWDALNALYRTSQTGTE